MERLKRMSVFARVVELGSFTAAARQLQMSVSSISQTVAKLEDELQVKLLNRSTRSLGLTEAGKIYYQGCRRMLFEVGMSMNSYTRLTIRPSVRCASAVLQLWHRMSRSHNGRYAQRAPGALHQPGHRHPGAGPDRGRSGRGDSRGSAAGLQPLFPPSGLYANGALRGEKLSPARRMSGKAGGSRQPLGWNTASGRITNLKSSPRKAFQPS